MKAGLTDGQMAGLTQDRATRVVVVRHGETAWNADRRMQGQLDIPLNAHGRWQAERVADALGEEGFDAIYSSDLQRAHATANAVAARAGVGVVTDEGLRERCFGIFEGITYAEIAACWPEQARRWHAHDPEFSPEGGETLNAFYARCVQVAGALCARHPGQSIALIAHGGVLDCLYRAATQATLEAPRSWQLGNASVNRLLYTDPGFRLVGWNDRSHFETPGSESLEVS